MKKRLLLIFPKKYNLLWIVFFVFSCQNEESNMLFTEISKSKTGIDFRNMIKEDENFNIFKYQYYYNGGGVAVGDFNNDELQDIVFTGNMVKNRMYLNQGNFEFKDITKQSGIAEAEGWCTGVVPVDINEDGWLDLYICRAGYPFEKLRRNLLYINNGDLTFTEKAKEYGLDDPAHATQASFFDFDRDGDLDMFLLNHSTVEYSRGSLEVVPLRRKKEPQNTNKLFRNDNGQFINVTEEAGIFSNVLSFSLGITISDINNDGWMDIFIGNDFNEPDYLFINNQDGTFSDEIENYLDHTSMFSMGTDAADINNDGWLDLVSLDMLPESNYLQKMHSGADNYQKIDMLTKNGFFKQYSRNMLQLNNGDGTFSEIGQLAGVSNTDWSWSSLFFDFENDGNKDLFISNGYLRDHTDMDFLQFTSDEIIKINKGGEPVDFAGYLNAMPPILQPNYFYQNQGNLHFKNQVGQWVTDQPKVTQGATFADLDNDGDMDMVWNNSGEIATVLKNNAEGLFDHHYLKLKLLGAKGNPQGIGTKVKVYAGGELFYQEQNPVRGFQTSVDPRLNFGLGNYTKVDSIIIIWPTGEKEVLINVTVDQSIQINIKNASVKPNSPPSIDQVFKDISDKVPFKHQENQIVDLKHQFLLPYFYSRQGPAAAIGDINGDQLDDIFIGNAKGKVGKLFVSNNQNSFVETDFPLFENHAKSEDVNARFFDADQDGDLDLYVVSGGYNFDWEDEALQDRLYVNDGKGRFSNNESALPQHYFPGSCIKEADIDNDGDLDLFIGGAVIPNNFPKAAPNQLLINNGNGTFESKKEKALNIPGIVTDAIWMDLNDDQYPELIIVGEWMSIQVFENRKGTLRLSEKAISFPSKGLWNTIHSIDFDNDGDQDLVVGNFGTNSQLKVSPNEPLQLYFGDFDQNKSVDPILCYYVDGASYPLVSKEDLINQLPILKKKFVYFKDYANAQIEQILSPDQLDQAQTYSVETLETMLLENQNGQFTKRALPIEAMFAPVHAITSIDANQDGNMDIIMGGNTAHARVKLGSLDGNHGLVLLGDGQGNFRKMPYANSGIQVKGDVRSIVQFSINDKKILGFAVNDDNFKCFEYHQKELE